MTFTNSQARRCPLGFAPVGVHKYVGMYACMHACVCKGLRVCKFCCRYLYIFLPWMHVSCVISCLSRCVSDAHTHYGIATQGAKGSVAVRREQRQALQLQRPSCAWQHGPQRGLLRRWWWCRRRRHSCDRSRRRRSRRRHSCDRSRRKSVGGIIAARHSSCATRTGSC